VHLAAQVYRTVREGVCISYGYLRGLAPKSLDWIDPESLALPESTKGEISKYRVPPLRESVLNKYKSADSYSKVLRYAAAFLKFIAKTHFDTRYNRLPRLDNSAAIKEDNQSACLAEQEKNRIEHYVPLHPRVVAAIEELWHKIRRQRRR